MQTLDVGEPATINLDWYNASGVASEPSAITLVVTKPDGTTITKNKADLTGSESGALAGTTDRWSFTFVIDAAGVWRYDANGIVGGAATFLPSGVFLAGVTDAAGMVPCEAWTTWDEVTACTTAGLSGLNAAQRESAIDQASSLLFDLTDRVYPGICDTTRLLCRACWTCWPSICGCEPINGIDLGRVFPVYGAWDVTVDGVTLAPTAYKVIDRRWLVRVDGGIWPMGADIADNTGFRVSWAFGRKVPAGGRRAAALFAAEIAKACANLDCQIPQRVTNVNREGITFTVLDSMTMIREGRTGIALVDLWITADKQARRPKPSLFAPAAVGSHPTRVTP